MQMTVQMIREAERVISSELFSCFVTAMMNGLAQKMSEIAPEDHDAILLAHREIYAWREFFNFINGMANDDRLRQYFLKQIDAEGIDEVVVN